MPNKTRFSGATFMRGSRGQATEHQKSMLSSLDSTFQAFWDWGKSRTKSKLLKLEEPSSILRTPRKGRGPYQPTVTTWTTVVLTGRKDGQA